ncbi:DUF6438 domain-containing protein [Novosphingobium sp.]|uniref:DUF6438 domain-containing protein n=1 Tax=Novosphingobium sp. TaxID=1874826 RepID=UPI003BAAB088
MRFERARACGILLFIVAASACEAADPAPTIGFYKLDDQRLTGETTVLGKDGGFSDFTVLVTVNPTGQVIAAEPIDNYQKLDPAPALALVRTWTFHPQTFDGKPVNAIGRVSISYRKQPIPPDTAIPFPMRDDADFEITLHRGACFGSCPDYSVTVHGDGLVEFDTGDDPSKGTAGQVHLEYNGHNVLLPGRHKANIDPAAAARLLDRFRAARFFGLRKEYFYGATDNPTQVLTVRIGKTSKTVTDYIGTMAGMPQSVVDLEEAVDAVTGTARWVDGNLQTLDELDAAHFEYHSPSAAMLAAALASKLRGYRQSEGTEKLLMELVDRRVPLDARIDGQVLRTILVRAAAMRGSDALFGKLAERDALAAVPRAALTEALNHVGCSVGIARALVKAGADPKAPGEDGTALTALRGSVATCEEHPDKELEMARTLIELGVPLEACDSLGWTALMGCDSPELVKLLLALPCCNTMRECPMRTEHK